MKLCVVAVGNKMPAWINSGFQEYARRMPREASLSLVEVKPEKREKANLTLKEKERLLTREAERIALNIPARSLIVVLDERGKTASTVHFAKQLTEWMKNGKDVT